MKKYLKYGLATFAGTGVLFVLLLAAVSLAIDPNDYKPQIVQLVKEKKQRTLTLAGDIKLAFFPKLGLDLGSASVSEYQGEREFAAVESARLYLSWWPLLKNELVVDQVRIEGVRANLVRFKDGTTNFDDLLKKEEQDKQIKFDIDSVIVDKSALSLRDELGGRQLTLSGIKVRAGRLANGNPTEVIADFKLQSDNPQINAHCHVTTGLTFDTEARRYAVKGMNLEIQGEAAGLSNLGVGLKGDVALDQGADTLLVENLAAAVAWKNSQDDIDVRLTAPRLQWVADKMVSEKITLVAKVQQSAGDEIGLVASIPAITGDNRSFKAGVLNVDVSATQSSAGYKGNLISPLSGNFKDQQFALSDLKGSLVASDKKMPGGVMKLDIAGAAQFDLQRQRTTVNLLSRLDESNIKLEVSFSPFVNSHIAFDLDIDRIDADRYLPVRAAQNQPEPDKPFDFALLKTLNASGSVRVGSLKLNNIKASNVRLEYKGGAVDKLPQGINGLQH